MPKPWRARNLQREANTHGLIDDSEGAKRRRRLHGKSCRIFEIPISLFFARARAQLLTRRRGVCSLSHVRFRGKSGKILFRSTARALLEKRNDLSLKSLSRSCLIQFAQSRAAGIIKYRNGAITVFRGAATRYVNASVMTLDKGSLCRGLGDPVNALAVGENRRFSCEKGHRLGFSLGAGFTIAKVCRLKRLSASVLSINTQYARSRLIASRLS